MHFYIDGDNCPGSRTCGIEQLRETDVVKVFYAENCKHYTNEANRSALENNCKGTVEFIKVKSGTNSVDFAMAVNAASDCSGVHEIKAVCLVSGDKHFDIVERELNRICRNVMVKRVETIEAGKQRYYMLEIDTLQQFHEMLSKQFGADKGAKIYNRTEELFYDEFTKNRRNRKAILKNALLTLPSAPRFLRKLTDSMLLSSARRFDKMYLNRGESKIGFRMEVNDGKIKT